MATAFIDSTISEQATFPWTGFETGLWQTEINVRNFIQQNYKPYDGDESFLAAATERTKRLWGKLNELFLKERKKGSARYLTDP